MDTDSAHEVDEAHPSYMRERVGIFSHSSDEVQANWSGFKLSRSVHDSRLSRQYPTSTLVSPPFPFWTCTYLTPVYLLASSPVCGSTRVPYYS
jgi:hypothetical protein